MQKNTIFAISFFLISLIVLFSYYSENPVPGGDRFHLPEPREVDINGIPFTISWRFIEDENSSNFREVTKILNHYSTKEERTFHQNDILLLDIQVFNFKGSNITFDDLSNLNDGSYENISINGIDGIFKNESVKTYSGPVKNIHQRYYFNYVKDNKLIMIQCDDLRTINEIVK